MGQAGMVDTFGALELDFIGTADRILVIERPHPRKRHPPSAPSKQHNDGENEQKKL
jgi:hypothetical protein